jgi:type I restriction enzyme S subunit
MKLTRYSRMKDSGIEWIGNIPKHWNIGKLRNYVIKIGSGITPRDGGDTYVENGIPLISSQNVHFDGLRLDDVTYIPPTIHEQMKSSRVQKLDVLMNKTGASLGRCTVVPSDLGEANVNQHVCIIRPRSELSSRFLSFYLASSPLQSFIYALQVGASRQGLTYEDIGSLHILIPPLDEQDKVANYLEEVSSHLDIIIKKMEKQIEKLNEYQRSLIFMVLTGKVDIRQEMIAS